MYCSCITLPRVIVDQVPTHPTSTWPMYVLLLPHLAQVIVDQVPTYLTNTELHLYCCYPTLPRFWMGVELDMPTGKNDGSMNGIRYFKCLARHGVFVLQSKVKMSSEPYHRAKRTPSSRTPVSSGAESNDYVSVSGSVSLVNSGASGASEAEMTSPSPHISPATLHKRLNGISSNNSK